MTGSAHREFLTVRTVGEALAGFRPARRTAPEDLALEAAVGRFAAQDVRAPAALPGFARATVDGYAVRAADTFGASEGLPSLLRLTGAVRMGAAAETALAPGCAVEVPTGGALPAGADAVVMVEHTATPLDGAVEVLRAAAPGDGVVRADEDVAAGALLVGAGRGLRGHDLGLLAAAGIVRVRVHARPRVAILSTGDEVVPPRTGALLPGQVRDAIAPAVGALVREAGGVGGPRGIVPDEPDALAAALEAALAVADLVVVSAGSSVGTRDLTAEIVGRFGEIWCHGLALKPGKPTLLAQCDGIPVLGLPGNPGSALVVFRLLGIPLVRLVAGAADPAPPRPALRARLARHLASAAGRLDVVQVALRAGVAEPLFGSSGALSVLTAADGWIVVAEEATGLAAGSEVDVFPYRG